MTRLLALGMLLIGGALFMGGCVRYDGDLFVYYPHHHHWYDRDCGHYDWHHHDAPPPPPHGGKPDYHGGKPDSHGGKPDYHGGKPDSHGGKPDYHGGKPDNHNGKPDTHGGKPGRDDYKRDDGERAIRAAVAEGGLPVRISEITPLPALDDARSRYQVTGTTTGLIKTRVTRTVTYDPETGALIVAK
jgi:hypothetical protein